MIGRLILINCILVPQFEGWLLLAIVREPQLSFALYSCLFHCWIWKSGLRETIYSGVMFLHGHWKHEIAHTAENTEAELWNHKSTTTPTPTTHPTPTITSLDGWAFLLPTVACILLVFNHKWVSDCPIKISFFVGCLMWVYNWHGMNDRAELNHAMCYFIHSWSPEDSMMMHQLSSLP